MPKRSSARLQRGATCANSNRCSTIYDASWRQWRKTAIADFLATTKDAKYCTRQKTAEEDSGYADLLDATKVISSTSSVCCAPVVEYISPAPAVNHTASAPVEKYMSPAPVVRYASPAPAVCAVPAPVVEYISPTPAGSYAEPAPVVEYISTVPAVYAAPAPLVEYVSPAPAVSIAEPAPTVYAAHDTVVEYISPATAMSFAAPTPVQYATPVKHAAPEHCAMDSSADTQPSFAPTAPEFL